MSYKWPGIPNGDYSFDHGRAVWNRIINFLRRLCEKLDSDLVDATSDRRGLMTAEDKAAFDAIPETYETQEHAAVTYAVKYGSLTDNPIIRTSQSGREANIINIGSDLTNPDTSETFDLGWNYVNRDGALLGLRSSSYSTEPGYFKLYALDEDNQSILQGTPNGELTWRGNHVITLVDTATTTKNGVMTAADKIKLDGISAGAEVNQNAFASVLIDNTNVAADTKSDTLTLVAGNNITLTADATNDKITIAAKDTVTTVSTTGNGNAVTSITANNGALTVKKDNTFSLSNHTHNYFPLQTEIPNNSNLNNYKTTGIYYCASNASAQTISNRPSGVNLAFTLVVLPSVETQILITFSDAIYKRWYRSWEPVAWTDWVLIGPVPPYGINLGGTGQTTAYNAFKALLAGAITNTTNASRNTSNVVNNNPKLNYACAGQVVHAAGYFKLSSQLAAYSEKQIATGFPKAIRDTAFMCYLDSSTFYGAYVGVSTNGNMYMCSRAVAVPANTWIACHVVYLRSL